MIPQGCIFPPSANLNNYPPTGHEHKYHPAYRAM